MTTGADIAIETSADTVLKAGTWAVTWSSEQGYQIFVPKKTPEIVPVEAVALVAAGARLHEDQAFRDECAEGFMGSPPETFDA